MNLAQYVQDVAKRYAAGNAREHTYRGTLQNLLEDTIPNIQATNEPARIKCGAPDYVLTRKNIPVGYIEAKDIGVDLNKTENDEQLSRYLDSLDNLILTDYLEFRFFRNKQKVEAIRIAEITGNAIRPLPENFERLQTLLIDFATFQGQTIKSAKKLAEMMAGKAKMMRDVFRATLESEEDSTLKEQMAAFKAILMHDLDAAQFADIYAQTITYGLFTARLHDSTLDTFSRGEALTLIPASNPFLRQLFTYVAGADLDPRVVWIVDALCEVYRATNLDEILADFGTATGQKDPILHFYETFLGAYDKNMREIRGVWYTPEPVVQFIVRAIDDVLKDHFDLKEGIASTEKIEIEVDDQHFDGRTKSGLAKKKVQVHKVQMLDVATGTGTFLAEAVKRIYSRFKGQEGLWSRYVDDHLLPRLHGFELLMASYAMCHMKLDMLLQETGYKPSASAKRFSVYLTNSLEEHHKDSHLPFANWLSQEANEASRIKRDMPIMVAFGNPPYSGESQNKGDWIMNLMGAYKKEPGGKIKLQEKNSKWINDDYVKFIRLGEHYIEKNGEGVLAYITNHSYLDNPTFRGMRWHLLNTFDDIYILDLHGNTQRREITPDGQPDKNVFDIQQGVSIILAIKKQKTAKKKDLARLHHADLYGKRPAKYDALDKGTIKSIQWKKLRPQEPLYFFVAKDNDLLEIYQKGFALNELFPSNSVGIVTARDALTIHERKEDLIKTIHDFSSLPVEEARKKYNLGKDARDWKIDLAQKELQQTNLNPDNIHQIIYRPFDTRWTYFTGKSKGFHCMPRGEVMKHMLYKNIGLITARSNKSGRPDHFFISKHISEAKAGENSTQSCLMPLYRYESLMGDIQQKVPNFDEKTYAKIKKTISGLTPEGLFDYIYSVLHAPTYRQRYAEFLKSDFPRIPYPENSKTFQALAEKGAELRALHLMESPALDNFITTYPVDGDHTVGKPVYKGGNVYINADQYFGNVPEIAWNFYIGGYQPAQKWLKDRKGRNLSIDDIVHYQRVIVALTETHRIMQEIDSIKFLPEC
ncbi:MAG: DNA methyltransferase [Alphaproteobacteria bacterium]|nr:DNA methyltransferase [Alphaproteobacteria bacterium]